MKKKIFYAVMALLTSISFVSCGDEENKSSESDILKKITDNQAFYDGKSSDVEYRLAIRPANAEYEDEGAHYLDIMGGDFQGRFDLGTPLLGSKIDLAKPAVKHQFSFGFSSGNDDFFGLDSFENSVHSYIADVQYENESCFSSGYIIIGKSDKEFTLSLVGTLKNNKQVALKVAIPEKDFEYWN